MSIPRPHFLLFSDAFSQAPPKTDDRQASHGAWRFVLEAVDGDAKLEVEEDEPHVGGDRLDLLAVVRGLEALDQPSRVTLVTSSRYVARGFRYGLREWRENGWQWERFGEMAPIRNGDLWQRIDRALQYHCVDCRTMGAPRHDRDERPVGHPATRMSSSPLNGRSAETARPAPLHSRSHRRRSWWGLFRPVSALLARPSRSGLLASGNGICRVS